MKTRQIIALSLFVSIAIFSTSCAESGTPENKITKDTMSGAPSSSNYEGMPADDSTIIDSSHVDKR